MAKETAKKCLLYVGDGGATTITAATLAVTVSGTTYTITDSANGLGDVAVGSTVTLQGFTENSWTGVVKTVAAGAITITNPVDPDTRLDATPVAEIAVAGHKLVVEAYSLLLGQKSTTYDKSASSIDTTDKVSGNWGSSLAGTTSMTVKVSGQIRFTSDGKHGGWKEISDAMDAGETVNARLKIDSLGDSYYGPFAITAQSGGGSQTDVNGYDFTLSNADRLVYAAAIV